MGRIKNSINPRRLGQSTIEFTFAMIVIAFLILGMVGVFRWVGMDLAERRISHDKVLTEGKTPEEQLNPEFHRAKHMQAYYKGDMLK